MQWNSNEVKINVLKDSEDYAESYIIHSNNQLAFEVHKTLEDMENHGIGMYMEETPGRKKMMELRYAVINQIFKGNQ